MINEILRSYGETTKKIISFLEVDKDVDELMEKREMILKELDGLKYTSDEKLECYKALELEELDKIFESTIKGNMLKLKEKIKDAQNRKAAYTSYSSNDTQGSLFARKV
ncbi:hypothetical protein [Clostridium vincentii]|uniref:Flagellar protein FliT n=1 Tax=Clostridium vincentii TaxID=52704 RepID=A0A2T0BG11_9CLOT|nr:hypothetical protein [Clostridium vincentii]PRR82841.1 hypothetical protein CLVI_14780 [Clostridium vincentii]